MKLHFKHEINRVARLLTLCLAAASLMLSACKDEENAFQPSIGSEAFTFKPVAGGSIMHYKLPADKDIAGLNIRYKNFCGKEILRSSSALNDSLSLIGFNEANENVNAEIRLVKRNGEESAPIAVSFSTKDSAPWAFFDKVEVKSGWNGFSITTDNAENATGMAHVFYLGTDPLSGQPDTILIKTFNLEEGKDTMMFNLKQKREENTIVIRTEDFNGYMVREQTYPNIASYNTQRLDKNSFDFYCEKSIENEEGLMGAKYLFDGEKKGGNYFIDSDQNHYRTFVAGPNATGVPMYIDMHKNHLTAQLSLYAWVNLWRYMGRSTDPFYYIWKSHYDDKLPCDIDVFGAKDDEVGASNWDHKTWVKLGSYKQDPSIDASSRWCYNCYDANYYNLTTKEQVQKADSIPLNIVFPADGQGEGYRYLKIVVNETYNSVVDFFNSARYQNIDKYVTFDELELFTKEE